MSADSNKTCVRCGNSKSLSCFNKMSKARDGLSAYCRPCAKDKGREWRLTNVEYNKQRYAKWSAENQDRIKRKDAAYSRNNKAKIAAKSALKRARKLRATPQWLTEEQRREIAAFYEKAAELTKTTGILHEVDHIMPLVGKDFSGLHVPWNLQVLTKKENVVKGNRIIV